MNLVRLSALRTGLLYLQEIFLVFISVHPRTIVRPEEDYVNEKFKRYHRESNPQPTGLWHSAPPRALYYVYNVIKYKTL